MVGGILALALDILVVDRAAVADPGEAVEHDHLAGPLDQGRVGDHVPRVFQDGEVDARLAHELGDVLLGLVGVGVDAQEDDSLLAELAIELDQPGNVEVADRAVGSQEDEHDRLPALKAVERERAGRTSRP